MGIFISSIDVVKKNTGENNLTSPSLQGEGGGEEISSEKRNQTLILRKKGEKEKRKAKGMKKEENKVNNEEINSKFQGGRNKSNSSKNIQIHH